MKHIVVISGPFTMQDISITKSSEEYKDMILDYHILFISKHNEPVTIQVLGITNWFIIKHFFNKYTESVKNKISELKIFK